jgi:hypothetical protein
MTPARRHCLEMENPMRTKSLIVLLLSLLTLGLLAGCGSDDPMAPTVAADVDGYIKSLPSWDAFSPPRPSENLLLAGPADTTETYDNLEYNCNVSSYSITETPRDIVVFSPDAEIMWLGALLQGDKYAGGLGSLGELPVRQRAPLKVFVDLLTDDVTRTVSNPDPSTVASAIGELIQEATDNGHVSGSNIDFDQKTTHSLEQAALDLGISDNYLGTQVESSLSYNRAVNENTLTAYFIQKMFTVSVVLPQTPGEVFSETFTDERLNEQVSLGRIGPDNLPTYISSVVYGRMLMLTMTSTHSVEDMRAALSASREGIGSGSVSGSHLQVLDESRLQVTTVGGVDDGVESLITSGNLKDYFAADAPLTSARPLSYTVRNLGDNSIAKVSETTVYNINSCTPAARTPTGARYALTVDKVRLISNGCDGITGPSPEVFYNFVLHRDSGNTTLANRASNDWVRMNEGGEVTINSSVRYTNLYADGRGTMRVTGTAWDYDAASNNEVIGSWNLNWNHGTSNGQRYFTRSGGGCSIRVYVTINKVSDLYD